MTDHEVDLAQARYQVEFAPMWRDVLQEVHPVSLPVPPRDDDGVLRWLRFPNWRLIDDEDTQWMVDGPVEGLLFDVEHNNFWWTAWGGAPDEIEERIATARRELASVPRLVPIWGHQFVASTDDSPVFSIVQADLYVQALTLTSLVAGRSTPETGLSEDGYPIGEVEFWSALHAWSQWGSTSRFSHLGNEGT